MTRPKASECDKCAWWARQADRCGKGHSPRFILPRASLAHLPGGGRWGWMRVCGDFRERRAAPPESR